MVLPPSTTPIRGPGWDRSAHDAPMPVAAGKMRLGAAGRTWRFPTTSDRPWCVVHRPGVRGRRRRTRLGPGPRMPGPAAWPRLQSVRRARRERALRRPPHPHGSGKSGQLRIQSVGNLSRSRTPGRMSRSEIHSNNRSNTSTVNPGYDKTATTDAQPAKICQDHAAVPDRRPPTAPIGRAPRCHPDRQYREVSLLLSTAAGRTHQRLIFTAIRRT